MTDDFKREIRDRMGDEAGDAEQVVSGGLFGIADADLFTSLVRETFPQARVGGVTNDQIEGAILRIGTGQRVVFRDEVTEVLERLGEQRVAQNTWGVEAMVWSGEDAETADKRQEVSVRSNGVQRVLPQLEGEIKPFIEEELFERGFPAGANTPAFEPADIDSIEINAIGGEVVYTVSGPSVDRRAISALEASIRGSISRIASANDPLGLPVDTRIEMEQAAFNDFSVDSVRMEIV